MLDEKAQSALILKVKFKMYSSTLDVTFSSLETVLFNHNEMFAILHLRSIAYCKIKHGVLQQKLSEYFRFVDVGFSFCLL